MSASPERRPKHAREDHEVPYENNSIPSYINAGMISRESDVSLATMDTQSENIYENANPNATGGATDKATDEATNVSTLQ